MVFLPEHTNNEAQEVGNVSVKPYLHEIALKPQRVLMGGDLGFRSRILRLLSTLSNAV